jgi:hypothetical protein
MLTPDAIAARIGASWARHLAATSRPAMAHAHVYASAWRVCERRMVYELVRPEQLPAWPPEVLARFRRGDDRERDLLADLTRIGRDADPPFKVIGQQERFELKDHKSRTAIAGKVDARIEINGARPPLEVKAWHPNITDRLETFADLFENPWTRSGAYQLLSYLFGAGEPFGFLLLDRSGLPKLLPVELEPHLDHVEEFLARAERVVDHVQADTLPDFLDDPTECKRCPWYGHTCNPPLSATAATILADPELEAALERREQLKASAKEYRELDDDIKSRLRGVEHGIIGPFEILGTWGKQSQIKNLPPALVKQYTVTNPKGRFTLEITRL